jgi:hypothetical protein
MKLWVIYFESANYCGYGHHCLVLADSPEEAEILVKDYIEEYYYEEDSDQYYDEHGHDQDPCEWAEIKTCEEFTPAHECWEFAWSPDQAQFYERINLPDGYEHE